MSKKEELKEYLSKYGEIDALKDISSILQDLSQEWRGIGDKAISYTFSDASIGLAEIAAKLEFIENKNSATQNLEKISLSQLNVIQSEYDSLMKYFLSLSIKEWRKLYSKNKIELTAKMQRLNDLKRHLDSLNKK